MFDNPRKSLERIQQELLASEEEPEEEYEDPEEALDEVREILRQDDWEGTEREPLYRSYVQSDEDEGYVFIEEAPEKPSVKPKKKGNGGFILAIILEILGLLALFAWWLLWGM